MKILCPGLAHVAEDFTSVPAIQGRPTARGESSGEPLQMKRGRRLWGRDITPCELCNGKGWVWRTSLLDDYEIAKKG